MINNTNIKIPKKYNEMIEEIYYEGKEDGYWCVLKEGFISTDSECGTIHEWTVKDLLASLKSIISQV